MPTVSLTPCPLMPPIDLWRTVSGVIAPASLPYGGVWRGHEGMEQFFLAMSRAWDTFELVNQEFLADTSPLVILTQVRARARATGRELHFPILQTIVVEEGHITEVRPFYWTPRRSRMPARPADRPSRRRGHERTAMLLIERNPATKKYAERRAVALPVLHGPTPTRRNGTRELGGRALLKQGRPACFPNWTLQRRVASSPADRAVVSPEWRAALTVS